MDKLSFDSFVNIEISADKLTAFLSFKHVIEQGPIPIEELEAYIKTKGIVNGLHYDNLRLLCAEPVVYIKQKLEIAKGTPSSKGIDGRVEFVKPAKKSTNEVDDTEIIDYKQVTSLDNVIKGQLIAQLIPPALGKAGIGVTGEHLPAVLGKPAHFKIGKNVVKNVEGTALYAAIDGLISLTDKDKINVFPVFEVNGDVDYRIGNIDFVGTVVVRGNVLTGFKIKASGDIRVIGGVEGAEIESDGSIEVTGGIMGSGKGHVIAQKNIKCSFVQDACISAGQDVIVSQSIMHSTVKAGRAVQCNSSKGLIVGGIIQASQTVEARTIGNAMSTNTIIEVGANPNLREEQAKLRLDMKEHNQNLDRSEKALVILDQMVATGKLTPDRFAMRQKLITTKLQTINNVNDIKSRLLEIEHILENSDKATVRCKNMIYSGVKIVIGRYTRYIKDVASGVVFKNEDGDITMVPYY